ncbi:MAG TPA: DUF2232 domain-containing protein [Gemmatimonadaceae bacterium]|nr:DUF2232 domain-containing protein [Gemmatimonadaceae bacterium]
MPATGERGWRKLILALLAFVFLPELPQLRAILPVEQTIYLLVPALAACFLVGWWAGGRALVAIAWVSLAAWLMWERPGTPEAFHNLERGWSLLLAGAFGLTCLLGERRPLFARALGALSIAIFLAIAMSVTGPVPLSAAKETIASEFVHRNDETMAGINGVIGDHPKEWNDVTSRFPTFATMPAEIEKQLTTLSRVGLTVFPSLLSLESLIALALAWTIYHRLSRARLGAPLRPLREFRFNDQLVWGLMVGLTIVLLPTLQAFRGVGRNLLVFFYALYAIRGLGVLVWFLAPSAMAMTVGVGLVMLFSGFLWIQLFALAGFLIFLFASFVLGLGDTWADWRRRVRPTA